MSELGQTNCKACTADTQPLAAEECEALLSGLPGWQVTLQQGVAQLRKSYLFGNFNQALDFTNRIGAIADEQDHHPALLTEWGKVTVSWWSHSISGLHRNDFIMAARTDQVSRQCPGLKPA